MLTPALIVTLSLIVVAALAFAYGMAVGRRRAEAAARQTEVRQQRENDQARHELHALQRRLDENGERAGTLEAELREARGQLAVARQELERLAAAPTPGDEVEAEPAALRERVRELEMEHQRNTRLREVDRSRMEQLRGELQRLEEALAERDQRLLGAEREAAEARTALEILQATERGNALAARHLDARSERQRIADLEDELATRSAMVSRLGAELRSLEESYAEQLRERDEAAAAARATTLAHRAELQSLLAERARAQERLTAVEAEAGALRTEVSQLGEQVASERARNARLVASHEERGSVLETVRAAARDHDSRLQAAVQSREQSIEQLRKQVADGVRALDTAETRGRAWQEQIASLQESLERDRKRLSATAERAATLDRELRAAREQYEAETAERSGEIDRLTAALGEATERLAAREDDLGALQEQLDARSRALERLTSEHAEHREASERRLRERQLAIARLERTLEDAREQARGADERRELAETQREGMLGRVEQQVRAAAEAAAEARRHSARAAELEADLEHATAQLTAVRADLGDRTSQAERSERQRQDELQQLQAELEVERDASANALQRLQRHEEALRTAELVAESSERRIAELTAEVDHLLDARERLMRDLHDREEQMRRIRLRLSTRDEPDA